MKFCIECGAELKASSRFCTSCGATVDESNEQEVRKEDPLISPMETNVSNKQLVDGTKKKGSKKTKIVLSIVIGLGILLFITHKGLTMYFDPIQDLVAMDKAVTDSDSSKFLSYITFEDGAIIDKRSYFTYIREMEWDEATKDQYKSIIEEDKRDPDPLDKEIFSVTGDLLFKVKQQTKFLGLYKEYTLHAIPTKLTLFTNIGETEVAIKGTSVTIDEADKSVDAGDIYPGTYAVEATAKGKYGDFTYEKDIELSAVARDELEIVFDSLTYNVYTDYDYEDAILFIDNKSSKTKLKESSKLGPVPEDNNLKVHAEWKDGKEYVVRSNTVQLNELAGDTDIYLSFDVRKAMPAKIAEQDSAEAGQFVLEFRDAYEAAVNYADFSIIEGYLTPDGHAYKDLGPFVKGMGDGYYYYEFDENTITKIKEKKNNIIEVETNELFTFYDDDGKVYDYDRDKKYIVKKIDGNYKIERIDYTDTQKSSN